MKSAADSQALQLLLLQAESSAMGPHATDADDQANGATPYPSSLKRLSAPPVSPRLRVRPWWFPAHELRDPLVFYMEAWVAEMIFGELLITGVWVGFLYS